MKKDISLYANWPNTFCQYRDRGDELGTYLLPETDARTAVEREEDEGVGNKILPDTLVQEPVGVEVCGWTRSTRHQGPASAVIFRNLPVGPQYFGSRCMLKMEYEILYEC